MKDSFNCSNCGTNVLLEDVDGNPYKDGRRRICDSCYQRIFQIDCPLCDEYFSNKTPKPNNYFFVIMPADVKATGMASGIYRGKSYPIWTSDIISVTVQEHNVELVKPLNKIILHQYSHTNQICPDCFKRYTNEQWLRIKYKILLLEALDNEVRTRFFKITKHHKGDIKYVNTLAKKMLAPINTRIKLLYNKLYKI